MHLPPNKGLGRIYKRPILSQLENLAFLKNTFQKNLHFGNINTQQKGQSRQVAAQLDCNTDELT